jgi:glycosyltransferase involved in cell wall biosynthesis
VICISDGVRNDLAARGVPDAKLRTIHPGFDPPPIVAPPADGDYAVFVGRLVKTKGLDVLLEALPRIPDARVVLVGKGPERGALEAQARRLGVQHRVRFAGFVSEEEKAQLIAGSRFVVHPAVWESFGHALSEAMLLGKPVLATDVGGIPEAVGPGGILAPAGDAERLAVEMRTLWADRTLREALGTKALQHARSFTWERCAALTERAYAEALAA